MDQVIQVAPQLHIRFEGRSFDLELNELDVGVLSSDQQIRQAAADRLSTIFGHQVPVGKLNAYAVDKNRETGDVTLRPEAVFGC